MHRQGYSSASCSDEWSDRRREKKRQCKRKFTSEQKDEDSTDEDRDQVPVGRDRQQSSSKGFSEQRKRKFTVVQKDEDSTDEDRDQVSGVGRDSQQSSSKGFTERHKRMISDEQNKNNNTDENTNQQPDIDLVSQPSTSTGFFNKVIEPLRWAKNRWFGSQNESRIEESGNSQQTSTARETTDTTDMLDMTKPGKPKEFGQKFVDSVRLIWEPPKHLFDEHSYQVRYKEVNPATKWSFHHELCSSCTITLNNLKSDSKYVFQVRMVNDEKEGPYSEASDLVETIQSAAHHLIEFALDINRPDVEMPLKKLPLQQNLRARNEKEKTRKMVIGSACRTNTKEKTIMLVGATGTGKSTLVDGMINYILGVNWKDPYRLTMIDLEEEERNTERDPSLSQTQWITCYTINPLKGSRLDFTLNIIDTPGFGDTRGIKRDKEIIDQIRKLFSTDDEKGVLFIDAICFLVKAPDGRLTPTQSYIFNAILSIFGQDIEENICMLTTFADGKKPPVLSALKKAGLPYEQYFKFNNSGLFAENSGENVPSMSSMYWEMGCQGFQSFFDKLKLLGTKSLSQTRDVLNHRQVIEITIENLLPKLDAGLSKIEELRTEIRILENCKTQIEENKDFTYTVTETEQKQIELPKGRHVTNCLNCHITCHKDCKIPNDEDKKRCVAMDKNGNCTQCSDHCFWNIHRNTPYIFEYVSVEKQKTYAEKLEKYSRATNEKVTRQMIVERMNGEVYDLEDEILSLMDHINDCNNILRQIALKPDPLSIVEHIDLLIESERLEKKPGFQNRIASLQDCRKKATVRDDVVRFRSAREDITHVC